MYAKHLIIRMFGLAALLAVVTSGSVSAQDSGVPDTIAIGSVQVNAGDHFPVDMIMTNDLLISAASLGFDWGTGDLNLDSVSFVGSVVESLPAFQKKANIDNAAHTALVGFFGFSPADYAPAGRGNLATFWFTAAPGAADQVITIDSAFFPPNGDFILIDGETFSEYPPQFIAGIVTIGNPQENTPPTLDPIGSQNVAEGANLNFGVTSSDAESTPTVSAEGLPAGASFTPAGANGTFNWTPGFDQAGPYDVLFITSDGEFADSELVRITVTNTNRAPVVSITLFSAGREGESVHAVMVATDPDGDPLSISYSPLIPGSSLGPLVNDTANWVWIPDFDQAGDYEVVFSATDGDSSGSDTLNLHIADYNRPPVLDPVGDTTVTVGETLEITLSAVDPDVENSLFYPDPTLPPNATFTDNGDGTALLSFTPDASQANDTINFFIRVLDNAGPWETVSVVAVDFNVIVLPEPVFDSAFVTPDSVFFSIVQGSGTIDTACVSLSSTNAPAAYTASIAEQFLRVGTADTAHEFVNILNPSGNTDASICVTAEFGISRGPGTYCNIISVNVDGTDNSPVSFVVCLTIEPLIIPDSAFVGPDTLFYFSVEGSSDTLTKCAYLTSSNAPSQYDAALFGLPLFSLLPQVTGNTDDSICVYVIPGAMTTGVYYNTIEVDVAGVSNNPVDFVTCLTITTAAPPDSAFFTPDTVYMEIQEGIVFIVAPTVCAYLTSTNAPAAYTAEVTGFPTIAYLVSDSGVTDDTICVEIATGALAGVYYNTVTATVDGVSNNPVDFVVCLTVTPAAPPDSAFVSPDTLFFTATLGTEGLLAGCSFLSSTNAPAPYIFVDTDFVTFATPSNFSGMTDDSVCISIDPSLMGVGVHYATLSYSVEGVANNFVNLTACLTIEDVIPSDSSILAISDTLFMFHSTFGVPFIGGDSLFLDNIGSGPDFGWWITLEECLYDPCGGGDSSMVCLDTVIPVPIDPGMSGITIAPLSGTVHDTAFINVDNDSLALGGYICRFLVHADSGVLDAPQSFTVILEVQEPIDTTVQILGLSNTLFTHTVVEGEPNTITDTLRIFNAGNGDEFEWNISEGACYFMPYCPELSQIPCLGPIVLFDSPFEIGGPISGLTPTTLTFSLDTDTLPAGEYWCDFVVEAEPGVSQSPQTVRAILVVRPRIEPSADTIWVATVPGTPGSKVSVPINMINTGTVCELGMALEWGSSQIFLDSVSFVGTRLEGIAKTDYIFDNGARSVRIDFSAISFALPPGAGEIATLYFDIFSGISESGIVPIHLDSRLACPSCALTADNCLDHYLPEFFPGGIVIDSSANVICGRVIDTAGNEIPGATVQVWDEYPIGSVYGEQTTGADGSFKFTELFVVPYALHAFAEGYYPNTLPDINFGVLGLEIVLTPVSPVLPTNEWVDFFCDVNTYMGLPLPIGSVVDAYDPDGDHVGTWFVTEEGKYGFMPVYRDDPFTEEDDGADPGDEITLYINGMPAEVSGDHIWTNHGDRLEVCLNFDGSVDKTICLQNGWNLISWNLDTELDAVDDLFAPVMNYIDVILSFEEVGLTYDPDLPSFSTLLDADHLHGYWVRIENYSGDCLELDLAGLPVLVNTPIYLEAGWNLVSYLPTVSLPTPSALVSQESNLRVALGYDGGALTYEPELPEFSTLKSLAPCFGYWLKVFEPRALIYPGFDAAPLINPDILEPAGLLAKLGVAGELHPTNNWMDIYAANLTLDGTPVRAGSELRVVNAEGTLVGYALTSGSGKLKFTPVYGAESAEGTGLRSGDEFALVVDGKETNETFVFTGKGDRLEIGAVSSKNGSEPALPNSYSLAQNYPNPFNPETKIVFNLPSSSEVTLEIFNVLGARIATLAEGTYSAGANTVIWDARTDSGEKVSSGIYFYRLKAGDFSQTRKMVLLK